MAAAKSLNLFSESSAVISGCGAYRYKLSRTLTGWDYPIAWIMLNPSTADADSDDATVRKVVGFSRMWGYSRVEIYNIFAFRSTDPAMLREASDPVGPDNHGHLLAIPRGMPTIAAWGSTLKLLLPPPAVAWLSAMEKVVAEMMPNCLGKNIDGSPKHPVRLGYATRVEVWP